MAPPQKPDSLQDFRPRGTVFVLVLFMIVLVALWASVYLILIQRGVTL
jgi:hypothetical protein